MRDPSFLLQRAFRHFRTQRLRLFERTFAISEGTRILDVGGSPEIWSFSNLKPQLTILNMPSALAPHSHASLVGADGRMLPFSDGAFDIVFSNSVIEHVGTSRRSAAICPGGVARRKELTGYKLPIGSFRLSTMSCCRPFIFCQSAGSKLSFNRFTGWEHIVRPTADERRNYLHHFLNELNLLDSTDMKALFPDANVIKERFLGIPKSLIAVKM